MSYLAFLFAVFAGSSFAFGGRPFGRLFLMKSKTAWLYRDSVVTGLTPALKRACLTAEYSLPSFSAISRIVKKFTPLIIIALIIGIFLENITFCNILLNFCIVKKENIFKIVTKSNILLLKMEDAVVNIRGYDVILSACDFEEDFYE